MSGNTATAAFYPGLIGNGSGSSKHQTFKPGDPRSSTFKPQQQGPRRRKKRTERKTEKRDGNNVVKVSKTLPQDCVVFDSVLGDLPRGITVNDFRQRAKDYLINNGMNRAGSLIPLVGMAFSDKKVCAKLRKQLGYLQNNVGKVKDRPDLTEEQVIRRVLSRRSRMTLPAPNHAR
jgi:hypothetical protein